MKIAVASEGKDENSQVSPVSGRAPYYLIFEGKNLVKAIKNPFAIGGGGAGFSVAQMLGNEGVDAVISGKFGPNIEMALKQKKIKVIVAENKTAKEAAEGVKDAKAKA